MDEILEPIGSFGRYQKGILVLVGLVSSMTATVIYSTVFTAVDPGLICGYKNETHDNDLPALPETCTIWKDLKQSERNNQSTLYECHWDDRYYDLTIVNEYELVCDKHFLVGLTQTINLAGAICGLFIGYFSDRYGRQRCAFVLALLLAIVLSVSCLFQLGVINLDSTSDYIVYCIVQFICGALAKSLYTISYILIFELTTSKHSTIISNIFSYFYVFGEILVLIVAYFSRNWHIIKAAMTVYSIILVFIIWFLIPESPRYLISKGYYDKAQKLFKRIARINGKVSDGVLQQESVALESIVKEPNKLDMDIENADIKSKVHESIKIDDKEVEKSLDKKDKMSYIMKRETLIKTLLFVYIWFALSLTYYGVSLGITNLDKGIDPYLMFLLGSVAEVIGYSLCHLNDRFGRKKMMIIFLVTSSLVCLIVALIPSSNQNGSLTWNTILKIFFASAGKTAVSAGYNSGYIFNSLLFPTHVRTTILVFTTNVGRIGALISPQINLLQTLIWDPLPYFIFSGAAILAAIAIIFLPNPDKIKF